MAQTRQLAAIMFTDIEGYTAAMQHDEQKALLLKNRHRQVLQLRHQEYNGRIIQYYGDGTVSIFYSAVEAVQCALAMQREFCTGNKVPVRIGLHIGDIIFDEDQIFGDGVNLASRIESLGIAGSVLLSDKVYHEISNHPELNTIAVGTYQFKNVERPVEVYALNDKRIVVPRPYSLKGKTETPRPPVFQKPEKKVLGKSIAVLPFVNMSNDPDQEYFSEGVAEEILNSLSNIKNLQVAGRSSSFHFKSQNMDLRQIGQKLGVGTVLEGSVRKHGQRLRVTVQLTNVEDGFRLWSEKYDRNMDDLFAVQDEIAMAITEKLKVTLMEKDRTKMTRNHRQNREAYELYLKGRFYTNRRGASIITGIQCFKMAIDLDPSFALAHTGYADANLMAAFYGLVPAGQVIHKAKESAEKALQLDPNSCEPYCSLACYYACFAWNWQEAEKNFRKSIEINPRYTQAHYWYASLFLVWVTGDFAEAERHGRLAVDMEPLSAICYGMYGSVLHTTGKYQEALEVCNKGTELDAYSFVSHLFKGWALISLQRYDEALTTFEHLMNISNRHHFAHNSLVIALWLKGEKEKARVSMNELKERLVKEYIAYAVTGLAASYLGDLDDAFVYFERAFVDRDPMMLSLKYEHWVPDNLRADPRFGTLLQKIGYP